MVCLQRTKSFKRFTQQLSFCSKKYWSYRARSRLLWPTRPQHMLDKALTWFINGWISLVVLLNIIEIIIDFHLAAWSFWGSVAEFVGTWNWFTEAVIPLLPAFGAMAWRDRRRKKRLATLT